MDVSEDPSAIMRRIEARNLREQNLSSLPSIPLDGTYDSASDETSSDEEDEGGTDRWQTAQRQSLGGGQYDGRGNRLLERVEPNVSKSVSLPLPSNTMGTRRLKPGQSLTTA